MEWNEEVVKRVRMAMQDRARNMGCMFRSIVRHSNRENAIKITRDAITEYGNIRAMRESENITPDDWANEHYKMMGGVFNSKIISNDRFAEINMHYCPLLEEWKKMDFSREDQDLLCDLAMELDRNRAKQHNIPCDIVERLGKGDTFCRVVLWKKKKK